MQKEVNVMLGTVKPQNFNWTETFKQANVVNGIGRFTPGKNF